MASEFLLPKRGKTGFRVLNPFPTLFQMYTRSHHGAIEELYVKVIKHWGGGGELQ